MTIGIKHYIVWLQITEDDVTLVQIFDGKQYLSHVHLGTFFAKLLVFVKSSAHVATVCVFKKHEQLFRGLESIFETNNERMLSVG
jgi:hypothetical protein